MNDNLVDLAAKRAAKNKPVTRSIVRGEPPPPAEPIDPKECELQMLRDAEKLVEGDVLEGVIIMGRKKGTQIFHTNHALNQTTVPANELWAFIGVLHGLAMELTDIANTRSKELLEDGSISDPEELEGPEQMEPA